jgi:phosphoribosylanthranilate isomerase
MALKTLVKVGSVTNLSDARYCAGMGVDLLGFNVVPGHDKYVTPKQFQEIRGWITGPKIVAQIYGLNSVSALQTILEEYQPDFLELGQAELPFIGGNTLPIILSMDDDFSIGQLTPAYVQVKFDSTVFIPNVPVLVFISSTTELDEVLKKDEIAGIALHGGQEIKPGLKTYDELGDILELLETD